MPTDSAHCPIALLTRATKQKPEAAAMQKSQIARIHPWAWKSVGWLMLPIFVFCCGMSAVSAQEPGLSILKQLQEKNVKQALETLGPISESAEVWSSDDERGLVAAGGGLHRALAQLAEDEQYQLLYEWSLPTNERKSVRIFTTYVPREAPP